MRSGVVFITFVCMVLTFFAGRCSKQCTTPTPHIEVRTQYDTVRITEPIETIRYVTRYDSVPVYHTDTITDTTYIYLPIERKEYRTDDYFAIVEGYKPLLAYIETYNKAVYIDRVEVHKVRPRWSFGIQLGGGYNAFENNFGMFVGVGIQYNLLTW